METILSPAERVRRAIFGPAPDRPACGELVLDDTLIRESLGGAGPVAPEDRRELIDILELDLVVVPLSHGWGESAGRDVDAALEEVAWWKENTHLFVFALIDGPFSHAVKTWGFQETMGRLMRLPEDARGVFAGGALHARGQARSLLSAGADGIVVGDDIAYTANLYVSPQLLRDLDYFAELTNIVRDITRLPGRPAAFFHSDGNIRAVLPDLVAAGFDGVQGLEPGAGLDLARVRAQAGSDLCLWGNVALDWLTYPRAPDQIHALGQDLAVRAGPRFILGTSGGLAAGLPLENVVELYRGVRRRPGGAE